MAGLLCPTSVKSQAGLVPPSHLDISAPRSSLLTPDIAPHPSDFSLPFSPVCLFIVFPSFSFPWLLHPYVKSWVFMLMSSITLSYSGTDGTSETPGYHLQVLPCASCPKTPCLSTKDTSWWVEEGSCGLLRLESFSGMVF